ncbi:MAG TPA: TrmH family RNA methyltransferase [Actinomycetota bacterium]|nr:TrmH family RNA methyltransferase [Actinomycetota bacterium]
MREKDRRFLVEGMQAVHEALRAQAALLDLFHVSGPDDRLDALVRQAASRGVACHPVTDQVMAALTSTVTPQGVVGVVEFLDVPLSTVFQASTCIPVLVEVRDPGNAGTIVRSADASGAAAVVFTPSSVDVYNPKTVRATAGSLFHLPVVREAELEAAVGEFRRRGFKVCAADAEGSESIYDTDLTGPTAILFGNEAHGLSSEVAALAETTVRVPISGRAESLNLAAAATLALFESARQRAGGAPQEPSAEPSGDSLANIVAGAAHDIRSPLTALGGFASTLISRWDRLNDEQRLQMLEGIVHDAARMNVIITQLVDAARLATGSLGLAAVPTDLGEAVREIVDEVSKWATFDVEVTGGVATVRAAVDRARLRTIVLAIVEAANWWGEEGPVQIEAAGSPPSVLVRRRGTSLTLEEAEALLHPRAPGTGGGSKAGMFVAKGLVEAHGGKLDVEVEGGIGFRVTLPAP